MTKNRQKTPIWGTLLGHSRIAVPLLFQDIPHFGHKKGSLKSLENLLFYFLELFLRKLYFQHIFEHKLIGEMCIYPSN